MRWGERDVSIKFFQGLFVCIRVSRQRATAPMQLKATRRVGVREKSPSEGRMAVEVRPDWAERVWMNSSSV